MFQKNIDVINSLLAKRSLTILFLLWLFMQVFIYSVFGIVTTGEAPQYGQQADYFLQHGHFTEQKYIFYSAYIFLHLFFKKAGIEIVGIYVFQLLLNLFAMYCLYRLTYYLSKSISTAFICVLIMLSCYSWQLWTSHLYTESLFCPLIIIFTYCSFALKKSPIQKLLVIVLLCLLILSRPTGMLFIPVTGFLLMYTFYKKKKVASIIAGVVIVSFFVVILNFAMKSGSSFDFIKPLIQNFVICDVPFVSASEKQASPATSEATGVAGLFGYIVNNPVSFIKMAALKFVSFWGMIRPHYTLLHNFAFMAFFYPLYVLAFIGLMRLSKISAHFTLYVCGLLIIFTLSVMFTCDDWNNRFIMPILPFVILSASLGLQKIGYWVYKKQQ